MRDDVHNTANGSESDDRDVVSSRTQLLRAAADVELSASQAAELGRHLEEHPEDRGVIEFERRLRRAVASTSTGPAPDALRNRILAMAGGAQSPVAVAPQSMEREIASPFVRRVRWMSLAAALVLLIGGSFIVTRQFSDTHPVALTQQFRTSLVSFIGEQHDMCELHADMLGTRFKTTRLDEVPGEFAQVLGGTPELGHLEGSGLRFLAAGPCAVPGRGKSVRMVLQSDRVVGGRAALVSIHIQQDTGEPKLEAGTTYRLEAHGEEAAGTNAPEIFVWRRDGYIYFLTSKSEEAMHSARAAFGAKEPTGII